MISVGGIVAGPTRCSGLRHAVLNVDGARWDTPPGVRKLAGRNALTSLLPPSDLAAYLRTISTVSAVTPSDTVTSFFTTPRLSCHTCRV
jgi:hypothetical protein